MMVWTPAGLRALGIFLAVAIPAAVWRPWWLIAAALVFGAIVVGPLAILGAALLLLSSYSLGHLLWRRGDDPFLTAALGLAVWLTLFGWLVRFPIHYPWLWWILLAAPLVALRPRRVGIPKIHPLILVPLVALYLMALLPEVSADGLAMHLVIPSRIAASHGWSFDVGQFAWAVMPMGGDWAFSIAYQLGGEGAARLTNFAALCLLAGMIARRVPALACGSFLSLPLVNLVTDSLYVENVWALFLTAAFLALESQAWLACAVLAGAAMASKFSTLALALFFVGVAACRSRKPLLVLVALACAAQPYADAWLRTGNPVFPFMNHIFRSPYFDASAPFVDSRFTRPLTWHLPFDLTFHSDRYLEGQAGAFGFQWSVFLPLMVLAWKRATRMERFALAAGLAAALATFAVQSNIRYLYAVMALWTLAIPSVLRTWPWTRWLLGACVALNFWFWAAANWNGRDFLTGLALSRRQYLEEHAPTRLLLDGQREPVAFLKGAEVGLLQGRAYVDTWHNAAWQNAVLQAHSPEDLVKLMRERGVSLWIGPLTKFPQLFQHPYDFDLALTYSDVVATVGTLALYRLRERAAEPPPQAVVGPGEYDEWNPGTRYSGPWAIDNQFAEAYSHTLRYCGGPPCWMEFRFRGGVVTIIYTAAYNRGRARILLDGREAGILVEKAEGIHWQQRYAVRAPAAGAHVLRVEVLEGYVDVDGFLVTMDK